MRQLGWNSRSVTHIKAHDDYFENRGVKWAASPLDYRLKWASRPQYIFIIEGKQVVMAAILTMLHFPVAQDSIVVCANLSQLRKLDYDWSYF